MTTAKQNRLRYQRGEQWSNGGLLLVSCQTTNSPINAVAPRIECCFHLRPLDTSREFPKSDLPVEDESERRGRRTRCEARLHRRRESSRLHPQRHRQNKMRRASRLRPAKVPCSKDPLSFRRRDARTHVENRGDCSKSLRLPLNLTRVEVGLRA